MRAGLMSAAADFDPRAPEPPSSDELVQDLQLEPLWQAMAGGDAFLHDVARSALLHPLTDPAEIAYRQRALADCERHDAEVRELYDLAIEALTVHRHGFLMLPAHGRPDLVLSRSVRMLEGLAEVMERLRRRCAQLAPQFSSPAFLGLFALIARELDDDQMALIRLRVRQLSFPHGLLMSAGVGRGGEVVDQVLRLPRDENRHLLDRTPLRRPRWSYTVPDRDEAGFGALEDLRNRALNDVADAAAQAVDHVLSFFGGLRAELGFYLACRNLARTLDDLAAPRCTPDPATSASMRAAGLYDPCLALRTGRMPVGNDVSLGASRLLVITGANRGGKSTLLRAIGIAQLMMQAGMFAPAAGFAARPVGAVFSHWAREEDRQLRHGKLDDELDRMSRIVEEIAPGDLLLCNESFAATNEAEGSQLLLDVVRALVAAGIQLGTVTHLYDFAHAVAEDPGVDAVMLRALRTEDGRRPFRMEPGAPLRTSYGLDLYDRAFGTRYASREGR